MLRFARVVAVAFLIVAANIAYVSAKTETLPPPPHTIVAYGDHLIYLELARAPLDNDIGSPFCWRLLSPLIVHALLDSDDLARLELAFYFLNATCLVACLIVFFFYLNALGFSFREGILGMFLLGSLPGFGRWYFYQYAMSDPPVLLIFALSFLFIQRRWFLPLSVALAVGVLGREATILILGYFFVQLLREESFFKACRVAGAVALPPVATLGFIHFGLAPDKSVTHLSVAMLRGFVESRLNWDSLYFATLGTWGLVLVFLTVDARSHLRHLARGKYEQGLLVVGVTAQLLVANNVDRLLVYAFPVVIPLALKTIRRLSRKATRPAFWMLVIVSLQLYWNQSVILWTSAMRQPADPTQVVLFFGLCAALLLWNRRWEAGRT
jgi:hypothetical protein